MRYILSFPAIALVIIAFNILGLAGQWMDFRVSCLGWHAAIGQPSSI